MGRILPVISLFLLLCNILPAQTVTGRVIDQLGNGLAGLQLQLYTPQKVYTSYSASDGAFTFDNVTFVENEILPTGYSVSQNYPNPFNPKTRIVFNFPERSSVKVNIYNSIGQSVKSFEERTYSAGVNNMDIELNGLSNGVYIAQIVINNKYSVNKKLMLLYGSQHLTSAPQSAAPVLEKFTALTRIDSLVVDGINVYKTTFTNLRPLQGNTLNLGSFSMPHPCPGTPTVTYAGQVYNTVQIGTQCWFKENLNVGEMVQGDQEQTNNGKIEKYCYNNYPTDCIKSGGLYQWDEAMQYSTTPKAQGICPAGWHIPSRTELYDSLNSFVKGYGNKLKRDDQGSGEGKGTNESGFSSLLVGARYYYNNGGFGNFGYNSSLWSSTEYSTKNAYNISQHGSTNGIYLITEYKINGFNVRCIKDN